MFWVILILIADEQGGVVVPRQFDVAVFAVLKGYVLRYEVVPVGNVDL